MTDTNEEARTVPVTLVAGFLGSGKTTLVNRILAEPHGQRFAVVVNEFGEVGIDGRLVVGVDEDVVELRNGCLCCTVRTDLSRTLRELLERRRRRLFGRQRFERILIEASGLAAPGPAVQTLRLDPELAELELDGIVTLTHARHVAAQLEEHPEAGEQVGYADLVLLNHADTADAPGLAAAEAALRACNARAEVVHTTRTEFPVRNLLGLSRRAGFRAVPPGATRHSSGIGTVSLRTEAALDLQRLKLWLQFLANRRGQAILRMKGILRCTNHTPPVVVQAVYQWLELGPGEGPAPRESALVVIGKDLDRAELERGWAACQVGRGEGAANADGR